MSKFRVAAYVVLFIKIKQYEVIKRKIIAVEYFKQNYHSLENAIFTSLKKSVVKIIFKTWTETIETNLIDDDDVMERYEWRYDEELQDQAVAKLESQLTTVLETIRDNINEVTYTSLASFQFKSIFSSGKVVPKGFLFATEVERLKFNFSGLFSEVTMPQKKCLALCF